MRRSNGPWTVTGRRIVYTNPWLRLREDRVVRPDGRPGIYGVVEYPGSVTVLAVDDAGHVPLVSQWRYPLERESLELPTGAIDPGDGAPLEAARRELREETGRVSSQWHPLGAVDNSNGTTNDTTHLFLALDAAVDPTARPNAEDAATLVLDTAPLADVRTWVLEGRITAGPSVAAVLIAAHRAAADRATSPWSRLARWW